MKDAMGNELKVGDLVALSLDRPLIFGRVTEIAEGGIVTGMSKGQPEVKPSRLVVTSAHTIDADPRGVVIGSLLALRDPDAAKAAEAVAGANKKPD
ncbi:MAG TPA: hypothetical protein VGH83_01030 [Candidatus Acidoferrum sp.]|jgi:hypothetical protein